MLTVRPIPPLSQETEALARARQSRLTKPQGSLGQLEALSIRLAAMTGRLDWLPQHKAVVLCAADHGIAAQGVSAYPQAVTRQMVLNFLRGGAAVNVLASQFGARLVVVDVGVIGDLPAHPQLVSAKVAAGTRDFSQHEAMSEQELEAALTCGLQVVEAQIAQGLDLIAVGEMGIGNTTAASALLSVYCGQPPALVTGCGTGLDEAGLARKVAVIESALALHQPNPQDALQKVGGLEIAAMAGVMLGAGAARVPVVVDGLISTAAALAACQLAPRLRDYLIAGHQSQERGHIWGLQALRLNPLLQLDLRLGEASGAVLAFPLIEAAMRLLQNMATFEEAGVEG
jgi:nicotinate-nucleotide--dimethylbenzimidazole phosphoribosyltransferase